MPGRNYADEDLERLRRKLAQCRKITKAMQEFIDGFNWVEAPYLFAPNPPIDPEKVDDDYAALCCDVEEAVCKQIRASWEAWLNWTYKDRSFEVFLIPPEETGSTMGVGFRELREGTNQMA